MPASGNRRCPTPELLRCNVKVIRRWFTYGVRQSGQTSSLSVTGQSSIRRGIRLVSSIADQDGNDVDQPPRTGACSPRCHKVHTSNNYGVGRSRRRTITASDDHGVGRSRRRTITASDDRGVVNHGDECSHLMVIQNIERFGPNSFNLTRMKSDCSPGNRQHD